MAMNKLLGDLWITLPVTFLVGFLWMLIGLPDFNTLFLVFGISFAYGAYHGLDDLGYTSQPRP